jgi:hypothetical protein
MKKHWVEELNDLLDERKADLMEGQRLTREEAMQMWNEIEDVIIEQMMADSRLKGETK